VKSSFDVYQSISRGKNLVFFVMMYTYIYDLSEDNSFVYNCCIYIISLSKNL